MARAKQVTQPESSAVQAVVLPEVGTTEAQADATEDAPAVSEPTVQWVNVRPSCPWAVVQSASATWGRVPVAIPADDPRLSELRRCIYLRVADDRPEV